MALAAAGVRAARTRAAATPADEVLREIRVVQLQAGVRAITRMVQIRAPQGGPATAGQQIRAQEEAGGAFLLIRRDMVALGDQDALKSFTGNRGKIEEKEFGRI